MSIICDDGEIVNNIIDEFGEQIILFALESREYTDEYDTRNDVYTQYYVDAMQNFYTENSQGVKEGTYISGQITFLVKNTCESVINVETTKVYHISEDAWYEVSEIRKGKFQGNTYSLELIVRRLGNINARTTRTTITSNAQITA